MGERHPLADRVRRARTTSAGPARTPGVPAPDDGEPGTREHAAYTRWMAERLDARVRKIEAFVTMARLGWGGLVVALLALLERLR